MPRWPPRKRLFFNNTIAIPLGAFTVELKGELAEHFPSRSKSGVVVASLLNGESEIAADLQVGDILLAVNGK